MILPIWVKSLERRTGSTKEFTDKKEVIPFDRSESELIHMNNITEEYIEYLKSIDRICFWEPHIHA